MLAYVEIKYFHKKVSSCSTRLSALEKAVIALRARLDAIKTKQKTTHK